MGATLHAFEGPDGMVRVVANNGSYLKAKGIGRAIRDARDRGWYIQSWEPGVGRP